MAVIAALAVFASRADAATRPAREPPNIGRGGGIRTRDPLRPRQVRYQAALRPDMLTHVTQLRHRTGSSNRLADPRHIAVSVAESPSLFQILGWQLGGDMAVLEHALRLDLRKKKK